jgi:hypothetical protein
VEPRETLRKITGKIQEPPKSTLSRQTTPWLTNRVHRQQNWKTVREPPR